MESRLNAQKRTDRQWKRDVRIAFYRTRINQTTELEREFWKQMLRSVRYDYIDKFYEIGRQEDASTEITVAA